MRFNAAVVAHGVRGTKENALFVSTNGAREVESLFLDIVKNAPSTGLIIAVLWYGQRAISDKLDKMSRRMDCFESSQHACQLDIAKSYATKSELQCVEQKLDKRITRLEDEK